MRTALTAIAVVVMGGSLAWAWEISDQVDRVDGQNIVRTSGERLEYRLEAKRSQDGSVLVKMVIPPTSVLRKASYLRLEITEGSKILLWSRLHEYPQDDGSRMVAFQIHQDLIDKACIGISYDAGVKDESFACYAYKVPLAQSVTDTQPAPNASRTASRPD